LTSPANGPTMGLSNDFAAISHDIRRFKDRIMRIRTTESTNYISEMSWLHNRVMIGRTWFA
jgi:hypothetical protein